MTPTEDQKEEVKFLLESGDKLQAVRYIQEQFGLNADQALAFAEELEKQMETAKDEELERSSRALEASTLKLPTILFAIFGGIGFILLGIGLIAGIRTVHFLDIAQPVTGKVVDVTSYESIDRDDGTRTTMYTPVLEYTWNGQVIRNKSNVSTSSMPEIGGSVALLIDPEDPNDPGEDSFFSNWFVTILLSVMGMIFATVGFIIRRAFRNAAKQATPRYQKA